MMNCDSQVHEYLHSPRELYALRAKKNLRSCCKCTLSAQHSDRTTLSARLRAFDRKENDEHRRFEREEL